MSVSAVVGTRWWALAKQGPFRPCQDLPADTGVVGVHERRARPTQVSLRLAQGPFLPDGVRALIVVVTHCQRAALLLHRALRSRARCRDVRWATGLASDRGPGRTGLSA